MISITTCVLICFVVAFAAFFIGIHVAEVRNDRAAERDEADLQSPFEKYFDEGPDEPHFDRH